MEQYIVVKTIGVGNTNSFYVERAFETKSDATTFAALMNKSEARDYVKYHVAKIIEEDVQ